MLSLMWKHTSSEYVEVDTIIYVGVCVYPDTLSQSFLYPEALDAEAVLGKRSHEYCLPPSLIRSYSLISSSSCHSPSSKNSLAVCQGAKG